MLRYRMVAHSARQVATPTGRIRAQGVLFASLLLVLALAASLFCLVPMPVMASSPGLTAGTDYYVDSVNGSNDNDGLSAASPWQYLDKVMAIDLVPGDTVYLRCGSYWENSLLINDSGTEEAPITFTSYGSGAKPAISDPRPAWRNPKAVDLRAAWIVIDGLWVDNTIGTGINIALGADHNTITHCEAINVGIGVAIEGQCNTVSYSNFRDLRMVVNTPGGEDDYGAVGVYLFNGPNEVHHCDFLRCKAESYDFGWDGGAVEIYGSALSASIHHNRAQDCVGFLEVGGHPGAGDQVRYSHVHHNIVIDCVVTLSFNLGDATYAVDVDDFWFENNTILESTQFETAINFIGGELVGEQLVFRNNIVDGYYRLARRLSAGGSSPVPSHGFLHQYNLYNGIGESLALGSGELMGDPLFADRANGDLELAAASPAVDAGTDLGFEVDFAGRPIPQGGAPDMGVYEFMSTPQTRSIPIRAGWNLISSPLLLLEPTLPAAFANISAPFDSLYTHDATTPADPWRTYDPSAPPYANRLNAIDPTLGVWLHSDQAATLVLQGWPVADQEIPLYAGWNLVGYPDDTPRSVPQALASIAGKYERVFGYDESAGDGPWLVYDVVEPASATLHEMAPGWGYWMLVTADCTLMLPS